MKCNINRETWKPYLIYRLIISPTRKYSYLDYNYKNEYLHDAIKTKYLQKEKKKYRISNKKSE